MVALAAAFIIVAWLKPWDAGTGVGDRSRALPAEVRASALDLAVATLDTASPTPVPSLELVLRRRQCQNPDAWRIVTMELTGPLWSHSLLPVTPVAASGPGDSAIVPQPFHAGQLYAIGYCVPLSADREIAAQDRITIWQQLPGGRLTVLHDLRVLDPGLASIGEVYFGAGSALQPVSWPDGRYVFEAQGAGPRGIEGWFALAFSSSSLAVTAP
jgi:hypothetical protein